MYQNRSSPVETHLKFDRGHSGQVNCQFAATLVIGLWLGLGDVGSGAASRTSNIAPDGPMISATKRLPLRVSVARSRAVSSAGLFSYTRVAKITPVLRSCRSCSACLLCSVRRRGPIRSVRRMQLDSSDVAVWSGLARFARNGTQIFYRTRT